MPERLWNVHVVYQLDNEMRHEIISVIAKSPHGARRAAMPTIEQEMESKPGTRVIGFGAKLNKSS